MVRGNTLGQNLQTIVVPKCFQPIKVLPLGKLVDLREKAWGTTH